MLRYPCLVLDHDDTVVQSEKTVNFPYFQYILNEFRPGTAVTMEQYTDGCFHLGFSDMCRQWYGFSEEELVQEYLGWKEYIKDHIPAAFPGFDSLLKRYREAGGKICVVSHSCDENISRDYLYHFGFLPDAIYGWDYPEHQRKPSVFPLEQIMKEYDFAPAQLLVVDDMKPGWQMAKNAGVDIAFSGWSRRDCSEIYEEMQSLCKFSFNSPQELEKFLFDDLTDVI